LGDECILIDLFGSIQQGHFDYLQWVSMAGPPIINDSDSFITGRIIFR